MKEVIEMTEVKVKGNRMEYRFAASDPIVKQIVEKAKTLVTEKPEARPCPLSPLPTTPQGMQAVYRPPW